ncbi:hypothetical protein L873DRAFT_1785842 [Choiromyces venosus 120613-1]|uniref:PH domain-containing protein n=1 Tax=Choiromyces venosus 120613-1 TaxID=1336337 RepID=A0A3N4K762_9PEZI|nr:hypothetical protein L873DRAFT_1785842 [Choiromyces venosus 120613-1]
MSAEMEDPFIDSSTTTPGPSGSSRFSSMDPPPHLSLPTSSPSQVKRTLEAHLQEVNKRIETAAALGRTLLGQQQEIEARIKEVQEGGEQIDPELKKKLVELEKEYNEVGRESARAVLTNKIMAGNGGNSGNTSPYGTGNLTGSPSTLQTQGTSSPSKLSVPSRRQRNQPSRQHDLEFAAELGQGLLVEVRRLQVLLAEREESLKDVTAERSSLEQQAESLESRLKTLDESEQKFKEENWNLELRIQDLNTKAAAQKDTETKLHAQISQIGYEKNMLIKELDDWKHQNEKLYEDLEAEHKHHEVELAAMRRNLATNESERQALQDKVDELKQELEESHKNSLRLRQMEQRSDGEDALKSPFDLQPTEATPENSPPPSPTKQTPRHAMLEAETVRSSLNHAHRMIATLKNNVHREKTEKAELKRMLQEARDELETARNNLGNGPPGSAGKRRKNDGFFRKPILRPNVNPGLLGGPRKSRDEVTMIVPPVEEEWEETEDPIPEPPRTPRGQQNKSAFDQGNYDRDATDAFETADEHGANATETEAFQTGNESPMADYPTSADELTETETSPTLKSKASRGSAFGVRSLRLIKNRHRDSVASTGSTEDDDDHGYRYGSFGPGNDDGMEGSSDMMVGGSHPSNPRLKLRINRARGRGGSRIASGSSLFSNRPMTADSSQGEGSPASVHQKLSTPGERKSLFAELGDTPMLSADGEDDEEEEDADMEDPDTPTKRLLPYVQMVDCGVMTEEPYPDQQQQRLLGALDEPERPRTAVTIKEASPAVSVGVQSEPEPEVVKPKMADAAVQSLEEPKPIVAQVAETGTQFDEELERKTTVVPVPLPVVVPEVQKPVVKDTETQYDPELEVVDTPDKSLLPLPAPLPLVIPGKGSSASSPLVKDMKSAQTQFEPELAAIDTRNVFPTVGSSTQTVPEEDLSPVVRAETTQSELEEAIERAMMTSAKESEIVPIPPLEFSKINTQAISPIDPPTPVKSPRAVLPVPVPVGGIDASGSSDEETPKKVSERVEDSQNRPSTPSPSTTTTPERAGFFGSVFGGWRRSGSTASKPETPILVDTDKPQAARNLAKTDLAKTAVVSEAPEETQKTQDTPETVVSPNSEGSQEPQEPQVPPPPLPPVSQVVPIPAPEALQAAQEPIAPQLPKAVPMSDQMVQTDITSEFIDELSQNAKRLDKGKQPAYMVGAGETGVNTDKTSMRGASLHSGASQESISRTGVRIVGAAAIGSEPPRPNPNAALRRPGSSSSMRDNRGAHPPLPQDHREVIAAAHQKVISPHEPGLMGPPPVPSSSAVHKGSVTFRPRTPGQDGPSRPPETPSSRGGTTPRPRFSTTRSEVSSPTSRRSSLSSFASELDERFNMQTQNANGSPSGPSGTTNGPENATDPRMIQAITQTMIGEYLWKYTRATGRGTLSTSRHKRFFWVHPYTRTLYWSDRDPTTAGRAELRAKSVAIEAVRVVTDDNPMPPGLHRKSLVIVTPGRSLKFTAATGQRHETWFNALSYLLLRTGGGVDDENGVTGEDVNDFNPGYQGARRGAASVSSYNSRTTHGSSPPPRNLSSLSNRRPGESSMRQGSMSRLSNIFRTTSGLATFSSRSSRHNASIYDASEVNDSAEELRLQIEREEREADRLENVRACCDGTNMPLHRIQEEILTNTLTNRETRREHTY